MTIRRELIDELRKEYPNPQDVLAEDGLLKQKVTRTQKGVKLQFSISEELGSSDNWWSSLESCHPPVYHKLHYVVDEQD